MALNASIAGLLLLPIIRILDERMHVGAALCMPAVASAALLLVFGSIAFFHLLTVRGSHTPAFVVRLKWSLYIVGGALLLISAAAKIGSSRFGGVLAKGRADLGRTPQPGEANPLHPLHPC